MRVKWDENASFLFTKGYQCMVSLWILLFPFIGLASSPLSSNTSFQAPSTNATEQPKSVDEKSNNGKLLIVGDIVIANLELVKNAEIINIDARTLKKSKKTKAERPAKQTVAKNAEKIKEVVKTTESAIVKPKLKLKTLPASSSITIEDNFKKIAIVPISGCLKFHDNAHGSFVQGHIIILNYYSEKYILCDFHNIHRVRPPPSLFV